MSAVVGVLLLSASIVGAVIGALLFRNPRRPAWARADFLSDLAALVLVGLFAFGTASLANFALALSAPTSWIVAAASAVGVVALGWASWRGLRVSERLAAYDLEAERLAPTGARGAPEGFRVVSSAEHTGREPPLRPGGNRGAGRGRKAA